MCIRDSTHTHTKRHFLLPQGDNEVHKKQRMHKTDPLRKYIIRRLYGLFTKLTLRLFIGMCTALVKYYSDVYKRQGAGLPTAALYYPNYTFIVFVEVDETPEVSLTNSYRGKTPTYVC